MKYQSNVYYQDEGKNGAQYVFPNQGILINAILGDIIHLIIRAYAVLIQKMNPLWGALGTKYCLIFKAIMTSEMAFHCFLSSAQ